jgi:hypothetical protein
MGRGTIAPPRGRTWPRWAQLPHVGGPAMRGSFCSWDEQDPSVHLSGFDPAVRFGGLCERQDLGMKVDEAFADGFERAFGCGAH